MSKRTRVFRKSDTAPGSGKADDGKDILRTVQDSIFAGMRAKLADAEQTKKSHTKELGSLREVVTHLKAEIAVKDATIDRRDRNILALARMLAEAEEHRESAARHRFYDSEVYTNTHGDFSNDFSSDFSTIPDDDLASDVARPHDEL